MKPSLLLCHGWALEAQSLKPLSRSLSAYVAEIRHMHLGYFSPYEVPHCDPRQPWIVLGHSYGFVRALEELHKQHITPVAAIAINGFTSFPRPVAEIQALKENVMKRPERTLSTFYRIHGLAPYQCFKANDIRPERLCADLDHLTALASSSVSSAFKTLTWPVLNIGGTYDRLLLTHDPQRTFPHTSQLQTLLHPHADHALGLTHITWCAEHLGRFLGTSGYLTQARHS